MVNLILTTTAQHFGAYFKDRMGFRIIPLERNKDGKNSFPDGEVYVNVGSSLLDREGRFIVVHSGAPDPNGGLAELEYILSVLKRANKEIEVFFTYMPYSMQDKIHAEGETNAAEDLLQKLVQYYGVKKIYAIDPHFHSASWLSNLPFVSVSPHGVLTSAVKTDYPDAIFVSPDAGHEKRAQIQGFKKTRTDSYTVTYDSSSMAHLTGKTVAVVDDIIETGGTMVGFHTACSVQKPKELVAVVTHGVLPEGILRLQKTYVRVYLSNTISRQEANVDLATLIFQTLSL
ncbi:MAG: hypothetical protein COV91_04530 [Candidatus Taylorbacteria bacterium CG11_big_fil_rev_8_21_14_0_20_46_11]|uniref:ribose-phosphate diphosphokinase n=1 Tax=Candidatus Taylorbacteria bacterium CG11_big_fil_rev_8_21_14_0_20_46_11 TaxID=1975025 RepID=A0A2H0KDA5_9BACT|nr:MAG: hypothetical protein COV91_04530 [Candidatus Taylorbacteria bacterium CG11_big_fil_rev_8_21_14_0_20_46_11]